MKTRINLSKTATVLIILAAVVLLFATLPVENRIEDQTLTVKFMIGKKQIDLSGAEVHPVPNGFLDDLKRLSGSNMGKIKSGRFKNVRTDSVYQVYVSGKGELRYINSGDRDYIVDIVD